MGGWCVAEFTIRLLYNRLQTQACEQHLHGTQEGRCNHVPEEERANPASRETQPPEEQCEYSKTHSQTWVLIESSLCGAHCLCRLG